MIRTTTVAVLVSSFLCAAPAWAQDFYLEANPTAVTKETPRDPNRGVQLGLRTGFALPFGKPYDADISLRNDLRGTIPIWIDAGYRLSPSIYVGAYGMYGYGIVKTSDTQCSGDVSCSAYDVRIGVDVQYRFRPKTSVDPWVGLGFGYEWLHYGLSGGGVTSSQTLRGLEIPGFQIGVDFEADTNVKLGPFIGYSIGTYAQGTVSSTNAAMDQSKSAGIANTASHQWLFLGLRGVLDI
jgi:hypothetical protein